MGFSNPYGWVAIDSELEREQGDFDPFDDEVREVYMCAVLRLGLPIDAGLMSAMRAFFVPDFLAGYPQTAGDDYLQR